MQDIPIDTEGKPLAWPDPHQPTAFVDAWNGWYPDRAFLDRDLPHWTAPESERVLAHGEGLRSQDDFTCKSSWTIADGPDFCDYPTQAIETTSGLAQLRDGKVIIRFGLLRNHPSVDERTVEHVILDVDAYAVALARDILTAACERGLDGGEG